MQLNPGLQTLALAACNALASLPVLAQTPPVDGSIGVKWMSYQETQGALERIGVQARSAFVVLPLPKDLALEATQTVDVISGASPTYYTEPRTFTPVNDVRRAHDVRVSWYKGLQKWTLGQVRSEEKDYLSQGGALSFMQSSADRNISVELGISKNQDTINPVNLRVTDKHKATVDRLLSTSWVITPRDMVQISWTHSTANGYLSDPYKFFDVRPDWRRSNALALRWNHHVVDSGSTLRVSTRLHQDSFAVRSLMLQGEFSQPAGEGWFITPLLRYYSQTHAFFFSAPDPAQPAQPQIPTGTMLGVSPLSFDQRLAAFGAITAGIKLEKRLASQTTVDFRFDQYEQRNRWSLLQPPTPGLANFKAKIFQLGISQKF